MSNLDRARDFSIESAMLYTTVPQMTIPKSSITVTVDS